MGDFLSFLSGLGNAGSGMGSWLSSLFGNQGAGGPSAASVNFAGPGATSFGTPQNSMYAYPGAPGPGPYAVPQGTPPPSASDLTSVPALQQAVAHQVPYAAASGYGPAQGTQQAAAVQQAVGGGGGSGTGGGQDVLKFIQQHAQDAFGIAPEVTQAIMRALQMAHLRRQSLLGTGLGQ